MATKPAKKTASQAANDFAGGNSNDYTSTQSGSPDLGYDFANAPSYQIPSTLNVGSRGTPIVLQGKDFLNRIKTDPAARRQLLVQLWNAHYYPEAMYKSGRQPNFDVMDSYATQAVMGALADTSDSGMGLQELIDRQSVANQNAANATGGGNVYTINLDDPESIKQAAEDLSQKLTGKKGTVGDAEKAQYVKAIQGLQRGQQMKTFGAQEAASKNQFDMAIGKVGANGKEGLTPEQIAQAAYDAGFRGDALSKMTAIALAESGGRPTAHNPNRSTGDNSYGLWQINMIDSMGPQRLKQFGLSSNDQLFDPTTNAKAAFKVSGGGKNFGPWTTFTSGKSAKFMSVAQQAAQKIQGGKNTFASSDGVVSASTDAIAAQAAGTYIPATFTTQQNVDTGARLAADVQKNHPVEFQGHNFANAFDQLLQLIRGGN